MIVFMIIGSLIGAGFASGQEMYLFFYRFGICGIFGLVLCSILIGVVIYKTFIIVFERDIKNYKEFLEEILKNKKLAKIVNYTINIFLIVTFYIMVSGFGAYFEQEYGISHILGAFVLALLSYIVLLRDVSGVAKISIIVVPILIVCIIVISATNLLQIDYTSIIEKIDKEARKRT